MHTPQHPTRPEDHNVNPYQSVTVVGNVPEAWQSNDIGHTIAISAIAHKAGNVINISANPYAESPHAFTVSNSPNDQQLVALLTQVAQTLEQQLHCWPSSELVTCFLMSILASELTVQGISFMPSLSRPRTLTETEYLPCLVHNWLGERRLALGLQLTNAHICWPGLLIDEAVIPKELNRHVEQPDINPFEVLLSDYIRRKNCDVKPKYHVSSANALALQTSTERPTQPDLQYALLAALSNLPSVHWLSYATQDDLITAEALFYNEQPQTQASYWYLMDYQASQFLDNIRHHLAYCQQVLALTAKSTT
jgi:hypothetical protein